jgi:hypothetical protein
MHSRDQIEKLVASLPKLRVYYHPSDIPPSGLYFFFEDSEPRQQIVRVGTHRADGGLCRRIRHHFKGNRRGSVFRWHLGSTVLFEDDRLDRWMDRQSDKMPDVEIEVSRILRDHFEFSVLFVEDMSERLRTEAALIGALAREPRMSDQWRGLRAARPVIRQTGLWNVDRVDFTEPVDLDRLEELVKRTCAGEFGIGDRVRSQPGRAS